MGYNFKSADRETPYLMPPSLSEWLPEDHLAWFIVAAVKKLNLSAFRGRYRADGLGASAYDPELMVGLMLYSYCAGERSSRKIEAACAVDVAYRVLMGNLIPDYSTICRFRSEHEDDLKGLFKAVLSMCGKAGLVKAGTVALDGTKMKAFAAKSGNRSYDHLQGEIDRMFEEAKRKDAEEDELYGKDRRGDEMPEHLNTREKQAKWIEAEMERIKQEAAAEAAEKAEKIARREAEEAATGQKKRGRKPSKPDPEPEAEAKVNLTDPDSRLMKTREGYVQGYNAQAAVTKEQVIIAEEVTQDRNDVKRLHPMLEKVDEELKDARIETGVENVLADAGYWSQANDEKANPA